MFMHNKNRALRAAFAGACVTGVLSSASLAQSEADQLLLSALLQEGELLQQEALMLEPMTTRLLQDKQQLESQEKTLMAESAQVSENIKQFNAAAEQLNASIAQQQKDCAQQTGDQAAADMCNARGEELGRQGERLQQLGGELDRRKNDVNQRIVRHNSAGQDWSVRNRDNETKVQPSQRDIRNWLGRFSSFYASDSFNAFTRRSGIPSACEQSRVEQFNSMPPFPALRAAVQCLKTLRPDRR
jgi:hypothetical protein